jgi:hypothetical protein
MAIDCPTCYILSPNGCWQLCTLNCINLFYFILFLKNTLGCFHKQFAQLLSRPKRQEWGKVQLPRKEASRMAMWKWPSLLFEGGTLSQDWNGGQECMLFSSLKQLASIMFPPYFKDLWSDPFWEHDLVMNWKNKFQYWTWATIIFTYGNTIVPWQLPQ